MISHRINPQDLIIYQLSFLKAGSEALSPILSKFTNECFANGHFPSNLKLARVIPIYKGGIMNVPSNFKPISILSVMSKLIEKIVYKRLIKYLEKK